MFSPQISCACFLSLLLIVCVLFVKLPKGEQLTCQIARLRFAHAFVLLSWHWNSSSFRRSWCRARPISPGSPTSPISPGKKIRLDLSCSRHLFPKRYDNGGANKRHSSPYSRLQDDIRMQMVYLVSCWCSRSLRSKRACFGDSIGPQRASATGDLARPCQLLKAHPRQQHEATMSNPQHTENQVRNILGDVICPADLQGVQSEGSGNDNKPELLQSLGCAIFSIQITSEP